MKISISINHGFSGSISNGQTQCDLSEIDSVWYRVKPTLLFDKSGSDSYSKVTFVKREWTRVINSLEYLTPNATWINSRTSDDLARNKPYQLFIAQKLGFNVPNTLISNNKDDVEFFFNTQDEFIYKTLSWYFNPPDEMIFTSKVTRNEIVDDQNTLSLTPNLFQKYVSKNIELRITIIGKAIFCVSINSQENERTKTDWRKDQFGLEYDLYDLPKDIEEKLLKFHSHFNLKFATYDFIVNKNNEYVFLEVNSMGQWLWLEEKLGLEMTKKLCDLMLT